MEIIKRIRVCSHNDLNLEKRFEEIISKKQLKKSDIISVVHEAEVVPDLCGSYNDRYVYLYYWADSNIAPENRMKVE